MIPAVLRLPRSQDAARGAGAAGAVRRRGQGPLRRSEPAAAAQAALRPARAPGGHRAHPRPRLHQGRRRLPEDRRPGARGGPRGLATSCARRTRSSPTPRPSSPTPRAQPGHGVRQPRPRRSRQRPPRHHAGPGRRGGGHGAEGRAHDPDRAVLHRPLHDRPSADGGADRDPHPRAARGQRRGLRRSSSARWATSPPPARPLSWSSKRRRHRAGRDRPHERRAHARSRRRRRRSTSPARRPTRPPSRRRAAWPAPPPSPSADRRGSVEYKKEMARVLTVRALRKAAQRAGGK